MLLRVRLAGMRHGGAAWACVGGCLMDLADMAQDRIDAELDSQRAALADHIASAGKLVPVVVDGVRVCVDCGYPIEPRRIVALPHAVRCGECQGWVELERNQR